MVVTIATFVLIVCISPFITYEIIYLSLPAVLRVM